MPRPRIELSHDTEQQIIDMMRRGHGPNAIAERFDLSLTTAKRRMRELRVKAHKQRNEAMVAAAAQAEEEGFPPPPTETQSLEELERLIADLNSKIDAANRAGDSVLHLQYVRAIVPLYDAKRKMMPPARVDPNENPDMIKLAEDVTAKLLKLLEQT